MTFNFLGLIAIVACRFSEGYEILINAAIAESSSGFGSSPLDRVCLPSATISQFAKGVFCPSETPNPPHLKKTPQDSTTFKQFIHSLQSVHFKRSRRFNDTRNWLRLPNLPICHRKVKPHRELPNSG